MPLITRNIWTRHLRLPFGNLLGILLLCLILAPILLAAAIISPNGNPPAWAMISLAAMMFLAPIAAALLDLLWRKKQPDCGKLERWISPFEGGTIIIFPAWIVSIALIGLLLFTTARALQRRMSHPAKHSVVVLPQQTR